MNSRRLALAGSILAMLFMLVGHLGSHDFSWHRDPISSFAARAPLGWAVTTSIVLSALTIVLLGIGLMQSVNDARDYLTLASFFLAATSAAGLVLVASFPETISPTLPNPKPATVGDIRFQAFHDAGLFQFLLSALSLLFLLGVRWMSDSSSTQVWWGRGLVGCVLATVLLPRLPVFDGLGIKQRVSLLCIWVGLTLFVFREPTRDPESNTTTP